MRVIVGGLTIWVVVKDFLDTQMNHLPHLRLQVEFCKLLGDTGGGVGEGEEGEEGGEEEREEEGRGAWHGFLEGLCVCVGRGGRGG